MSSDAQASYSRLSGAEKRRADALARQQEAIKRTVIEQLRLNDALGVTTGQVSGMAAEMGKAGDITRHEAAEALTQVAKSGKIAGGQMQEVATVAIRSAQLLGRSQQDVIAEFASIGDDPVKAAKKLNEQYNFLTTAVYEQTRALVEQGRTQDAVRLITDEFAGVTQRRLDDVEKSLGSLQRAWNWVGAEASKTWDLMLNIGRPQALQNQIDDVQRAVDAQVALIEGRTKIAQGQGRSYTADAIDAAKKALPELQAKLSDLQAQAAGVDFTASAQAAEAARVKQFTSATENLDGLRKSLRTREELRDEEIANVKKWAKMVGASETEVADLIARIDKKYADRTTTPRGAKGPKRTILYDNLDDLIASPDVTSRMEAIQRDYNSIANLIGDRLTTAQQRYGRELDDMGRGDWARSLTRELQGIEDKYNDVLEQRRNSSKGLSDEDERRLKESMDRELAMARQHFADMQRARASWLLGMAEGLNNTADKYADTYGQMSSITGNLFDDAIDATTKWALGMDVSFNDVLRSYIRMLAEMQLRSLASPVLKMLGGSLLTFGAETIANLSSDPIGSLISTLGGAAYNNAKGGVYESPDLSRYSNQVRDTSTLFTFARGAGVFGEAGPEAIMPLKRGPDGTLGVRVHPRSADGSSGGSKLSARQIIVTVPITINTPDANSFRKSTTQISREVALAANRALAKT